MSFTEITVVPADKKHPCADCGFCQWCGDDRCSLCRRERRPAGGRKLSVEEQIALYELINRSPDDQQQSR